jgi:hypothetical protein
MKEIKNKKHLKKEIFADKRNFLWKKKGASEYLIDFMVIRKVNKDKEIVEATSYSVSEILPYREEDEKVSLDRVNLSDWKVYSLSDEEAIDYSKRILARKIAGDK